MIIRTTTDLAHLIRAYRSRHLLTQAALAELVGVSRKWIVDVEAGKRTADVSLVLRTIKALGLEIDVREQPTRSNLDADIDQIIERSRKVPR